MTLQITSDTTTAEGGRRITWACDTCDWAGDITGYPPDTTQGVYDLARTHHATVCPGGAL